jgi:hypothetical protein
MPNSAWTETGSAISLAPSTTPINTGSDPENVNYLSNQDKINLIAQYAGELAMKTALDTLTSTWSVSSSAYDAAVAAISTGLINAGAPSNWATIWPDGVTSGPWTGIQTSLANWFAQVATQRTALQSSISAAQAAAAQAAAVTAAVAQAIANAPVVVSSLPALPNAAYPSGRIVWNTADGHLYVSTGSAWNSLTLAAANITGTVTAAQIAGVAASQVTGALTASQIASVNATAVSGTLTASQIASVNATAIQGTLTAAQVASVAASQVTGQLTAAQIASIAASQLTGQITGTQISNGAVSTPQLAAGAVTAATIAANTITASQIAAGAITSAQIAAGTVTAANIAAGTIQASNIAANTITGAQIAAGSITVTQLNTPGVNLLDASWWTPGASIPWNRNQGSANTQDSFVSATAPDGSNRVVWQATAGASDGSLAGGGWDAGGAGNQFPVNTAKTYMFVCYQRHVSGNGTGYWGVQDNSVCDLNTSNVQGNPYFSAFGVPVVGRWYLVVGWVYPAGSTGMSNAQAGLWDCTTGQFVQGGLSFCWEAGVASSGSRAYQYYSNGGVHQFFAPAVYMCDGTEPSLNQLLASGSPSALNPITAANSTTYIGAGSISTGLVAAQAITAAQIAAGTITAGQIAASTITGTQIAAGTVTAANIAAGTIQASNIAAGTITGANIAATTITAANIAADTITAGQIAAGAITASELAAGAVTTAALTAGCVTAGSIASGAITASMITSGTLNAANVNVTNLNASNITTGTLSASQVLFSDGTSLNSANRVATMFKQPSSDNIAVGSSTALIPGLSWSVTVHSANDVFNFFGALTAEQTSGTTNSPVNVYFYVDGVFGGSYPCVPRFPSLSVWYVFPIAAAISGLSIGAHTISIWANNNGYPFTVKAETRVTCQQIY